jgi:general secretion pathway protein L
MSRQILSIDIRNNSIAAIVLNTGLTNNTIEDCAYIPLPAATENAPPLQTALKTLLEQVKTSSPGVVISLPSDRTFYRTVKVPFKEDKKVRQVLPFELEPNLPVPVDDLIIDYQPHEDTENSGLLTAAIARTNFEAITADFTALELKPQLIVPGDFPLALGLTLFDDQLEDQVLLLEVGTSKATLFIMDNRQVALVRMVSADITSEAGLETLALNVRQTLTSFADGRPGGYQPRMVLLSGPAFSDKKVSRDLAEALELPAKIVNLRGSVPKLDSANGLPDWQPCLHDGALAMALIEAENRPCLNFHRSSSVFRNFWTAYQQYLRGPAILLFLVILLSLGSVLIDNHMMQNRVDELNTEMDQIFAATFPGTKRIGDVKDQMKSELKKARSSGIDPEQSGPTVRTIEKSELFKKVTIASANQDKSGAKVNFKLKIDL